MARIKNIELPANKHICIGLTAIYGIGRSLGETICKEAKVEKTKLVKDLTEDEVTALRKEVDKYIVEGDLRREVQMNIKGKMEINSYEGTRHKKVYQFVDKEHQEMQELVKVEEKLLQIRRKQLNNK